MAYRRRGESHSQSPWARGGGAVPAPSPGFLQASPRAWEWVLHVSLSIKEIVTGTTPWNWPFPWLHVEVEWTEEEG